MKRRENVIEKKSKEDVLPIILVHLENKNRGSSRYLSCVLKQARYYNPDSRIILLGNEANNIYPFIEHYNIDDYFEGAKEFAVNDYKHMSNHKLQYELFCYQRWFIINEFITQQEIASFCYLDSDVLVFSNLDDYYKKIEGEKFDLIGHNDTASGSFNPAINFYNQKFIIQLTSFLKDSYHNEKILSGLEDKWSIFKKENKPGGVCDMTQLSLFLQGLNHTEFHVWDIYDLSKNDFLIPDGQVSCKENYSAEKTLFQMTWLGIKKYKLRKGSVYGVFKDGNNVQFLAGHFQGRSKRFIQRYHWATTGKGLLFFFDVFLFYPILFIVKFGIKVIKKILKILHIIPSDGDKK